MYSYIKGKVEHKSIDYIVVENNGIGYKLFTSASTIERVSIGAEFKVYTYLHVREDIFCLYGFLTPEELRVFELLISVSGIGPKVANSVLSVLSPSRFSLAVISGDVQSLKGVSGVGLKTAQRIILELKDKLKTDEAMEDAHDIIPADNNKVSEAINALIVLGYSANEAGKVFKTMNTSEMSIEDMIKSALKALVR